MIFDNTVDGSEWREYGRGVRVKIKPLTKNAMRQFRKQATSRRGFRDAGGMDEEKLDRLIYRHVIEDWEGIVSSAGEAVPCTDDMIDAVTGKLINFSAWVIDEATNMAEAEQTELETELKN